MSIATQIERLQNAKENLKAKLIAKGVAISDDATLDQYADFVDEIKTEDAPTGQLEITANGNYNVINYAKANVNVKPKLYHTSITPTKQQQEATPEASYDGFNKVTVNAIPEHFIVPSGVKSITENGNTDVKNYASALVNVQPKLQEKKVTQNGEVVPDSGYDGLSKVTVNVSSGGGENTLKKLLDTKQNSYYLFSKYDGSNVDDLISYSDTENVVDVTYMFENSSIVTAPNLNTKNVTTFNNMFLNCTKLENAPNYDMRSAYSISSMFKGCSRLITSPDLSCKALELSGVYSNCKNLKYIPNCNFPNCSSTSSMFSSCSSLEEPPRLILSKSRVLNCNSMFYNCYKLKKVDFNYYYTLSSSQVFQNCYSLKAIIIRGFASSYSLTSSSLTNCYHFQGTVNATYNPNGDRDGYIYVPRNMVDTLKSATNWSTYADQIRALEDYTVDGTTTGDLDMDKVNSQQEGYNVNLDPDAYVTSDKIFYSFDNGSVWLDLNPIKDRENPILTGVTQIKFKAKNAALYCEELGMSLTPMIGEEESENYTLSQDITLSTM